jgi:hypothetical protein
MSFIAAALKPRLILIATDFSEASENALHNALALSRFYGSRFCLAHVVSVLGLTMAGPEAIAVCEEAVSREAAQLEASLVGTGALTGIQYKFVVRHAEIGLVCGSALRNGRHLQDLCRKLQERVTSECGDSRISGDS